MPSVASPSRRRSALGVLAAVLTCLCGTGCTLLERQIGEPVIGTSVDLQEGQADLRQVVVALGPPSGMSALPDGVVVLYEHLDLKERQFGINPEFTSLEWFKLSFGRARAEREALLLFFDADGLLRAREYRAWTEDVGRGLGFQLFFVVLPTVDSRHLAGPTRQDVWGRMALEPLPVTLNIQNSIVSGVHGLELRGTPTGAGQHSLEMEERKRRR